MLAGLFAIGQQARAGAERMLDILDTNPLITEKPDAVELPAGRGRRALRGRALRLHRRPAGARGLRPARGARRGGGPGRLERLGQVDRHRAAPPLLRRRRRARSPIDGIDVRDVTLDSLRRQVGVVFEEAFLFSDSVRANIAYGRPDATDDEIEAAAAAAGAAGFIDELPDGYDTVVGERGLTLSGGQRQRIALARAILTDPRILVLDDATSAVDAATEEAIHATLRDAHGRPHHDPHRPPPLDAAAGPAHRGHRPRPRRGRGHPRGAAWPSDQRYRDLLAGPERRPEPTRALDDDRRRRRWPTWTSRGARGAGRADRPRPGRRARPAARRRRRRHARGLAQPADGRRSPARWPRWRPWPAWRPAATGAGAAAVGGPMGGAALAATPELLAALDKLPPADDQPQVDEAEAAAVTPGEFQVRRFVRPWTRWLAFGLGLVMADALLSLLGPLLRAPGARPGRGRTTTSAGCGWTTALFALSVARRLGGHLGLHVDHRPHRPSGCCSPCASRSSPTSSRCRSTTTTPSSTGGS